MAVPQAGLREFAVECPPQPCASHAQVGEQGPNWITEGRRTFFLHKEMRHPRRTITGDHGCDNKLEAIRNNCGREEHDRQPCSRDMPQPGSGIGMLPQIKWPKVVIRGYARGFCHFRSFWNREKTNYSERIPGLRAGHRLETATHRTRSVDQLLPDRLGSSLSTCACVSSDHRQITVAAPASGPVQPRASV